MGRCKEGRKVVYAKVFASLWDGTLGQNWEAWSVFVFMLANCSADGVIDMTPDAISRRSCIPPDVVKRALTYLTTPDPESRSVEESGRRLIPLDSHRSWGWRIVNHSRYRRQESRAVKKARDAERMRQRRNSLKKGICRLGSPRVAKVAQAEADVLVEEVVVANATTPVAMVQSLTDQFSATRVKRRRDVGFDRDRVAARLRGIDPGGRYFKLAAWFWSHGTKDNDLVLHLLEHALKFKPHNWYAYYATDGEARKTIEARFREDRAASEKERFRAQDAAFLAGNRPQALGVQAFG